MVITKLYDTNEFIINYYIIVRHKYKTPWNLILFDQFWFRPKVYSNSISCWRNITFMISSNMFLMNSYITKSFFTSIK